MSQQRTVFWSLIGRFGQIDRVVFPCDGLYHFGVSAEAGSQPQRRGESKAAIFPFLDASTRRPNKFIDVVTHIHIDNNYRADSIAIRACVSLLETLGIFMLSISIKALFYAVLLSATASAQLLPSSAAKLDSNRNYNQKFEALETLHGSWVVISVEADGELTNAQIGQEPGDVITFSSFLQAPTVTMF